MSALGQKKGASRKNDAPNGKFRSINNVVELKERIDEIEKFRSYVLEKHSDNKEAMAELKELDFSWAGLYLSYGEETEWKSFVRDFSEDTGLDGFCVMSEKASECSRILGEHLPHCFVIVGQIFYTLLEMFREKKRMAELELTELGEFQKNMLDLKRAIKQRIKSK